MSTRRLVRALVLATVWAAVSVVAATVLFLGSSRQVVVASHDAVMRPTLDGYVVLRTGPVLPDVRLDRDGRVGVDIVLGKTNARTMEELVARYGYIASQPEGQVAAVERAVLDMGYDAAVRGALAGLVPVGLWLLLGRDRRGELRRVLLTRRGVAVLTVVVLAGVVVWEPWDPDRPTGPEEPATWLSLDEYLGPDRTAPEQAAGLEIRADDTPLGSRRLLDSALETYDKSRVFYEAAATEAAGLDLRTPREDEVVVALVSDRHDNIGMDVVARAVADAGGATAVFDAGDDTSSGGAWEAFSLDSVTTAFEDLDRFAVAGNHDHGGFVSDYLDDLGWTVLDGEVVDGPGGAPLLGLDDPRSSGLGSWRDETGLSFEEVGSRLSDVACEAEERVATILVHDANLAREALARGCADLVLGGHLHVRVGPTPVLGENGEVGYSYTTGTTGGAAYALAVGSKPRRDAMVTLVTYADGRPAGLQSVVLQTNGVFLVGRYVELDLTAG